ncbi:MAG: hypothetical protein OJJ21_20445 [Ferrovibrio sp.]|uniref:hypothetical protein n=1 Tax=Ferrovibrio sp. TaxID=1917215 RepID=UPI00262F4BD9|nr:hypothetical protein [Ferrovibrio sp.]MCW0235978.1 hypothetical protein [Ferrovibrio sp.]
MKPVSALALVLGLGLLTLSAPGFAQACRQTLDMTPMGGQKMVQCHEVTEMPQSTINNMCRPAGDPAARTVSEQLDKCPAAYAGICATPLRVIQANIRRMQGLPPEVDSQVPETAMIKAYFYDGMPPNAAEQCTRSGGTWTAAKAPARKK